MTPEEQAARQERSRRALEPLPKLDTVNSEGAVLHSSGMPVREPPPLPVLRAAPAKPHASPERLAQPDHWGEWRVWAELVDARIAGLRSEIAEGTGEAIAAITKEEREVTKRAIGKMREQLRAEYKSQIDALRRDVMAAIAKDGNTAAARLDASLAGLDRVVSKWDRMTDDALLDRMVRADRARLAN